MATKKKPVKPKAVREEPEYWTVLMDRSLMEAVERMASILGYSKAGFCNAAVRAFIAKHQAKAFIAEDGK